MCVGLSAKVVKISDGTAVVDAGGAKREVSAQLLGDLEPGDYVMVQVGYDDVVIPRRITATTTGVSPTITFDAPIKNVAVSIGSKIRRCLVVPVGRKSEQAFLAAKIVGSMADGREIAIEIPKLRVTKGFDVTFQTSDYANMPFEYTVYDQVPSDPQYARFKDEFDGASAVVYTNH